jgi:hypothetical protein
LDYAHLGKWPDKNKIIKKTEKKIKSNNQPSPKTAKILPYDHTTVLLFLLLFFKSREPNTGPNVSISRHGTSLSSFESVLVHFHVSTQFWSIFFFVFLTTTEQQQTPHNQKLLP